MFEALLQSEKATLSHEILELGSCKNLAFFFSTKSLHPTGGGGYRYPPYIHIYIYTYMYNYPNSSSGHNNDINNTDIC